MVKEISCEEAGMRDCEFLIRSENEAELIEFTQRHAEQMHDTTMPRDSIETLMISM